MERDLGFELPDVRETYTKGDNTITIVINRHYFHNEEEELDFTVTWDIKENDIVKIPVPSNDINVARRIMKAYYGKGLRFVPREPAEW